MGDAHRESNLAPSMDDPITRERAQSAGYDHLGGKSTLFPLAMTDHLSTRPSPNTATSGTVSGEAWEEERRGT